MKLDTRAAKAVLGHELCGRVAKAAPGAPFREGERVVVSHHVPCLACHYCRKGQESMCRQFKATNIDPGGFADLVRVPALHARHACGCKVLTRTRRQLAEEAVPEQVPGPEAALARPKAPEQAPRPWAAVAASGGPRRAPCRG